MRTLARSLGLALMLLVIGESHSGPPLLHRVTTPQTAAAQAAIGGRGLGLRLGPPSLTWSPGSVQVGYLVVRISSAGTAVLPASGIPLPADATAFVDIDASREPFVCYFLVPLAPTGPLGNSDVLCGARNRSQGGAPGDFTLRLNESSRATFTWAPPGGQDSYLLLALPLPGVPRLTRIPGDATRAIDDTGGVRICYQLRAQASGSTVGFTDILCGIPGVSTLGGTAPRPPLP